MYFAASLMQFSGAFLCTGWMIFCFFALYLSQGSFTCFDRSYFLRKQTALERTRSYLINYNWVFFWLGTINNFLLKTVLYLILIKQKVAYLNAKLEIWKQLSPGNNLNALFCKVMSSNCIPQISCLLWFRVFSANPQSGAVFLCLSLPPQLISF